MTTFTREKLQELYLENARKDQEPFIQHQVEEFQETILYANRKGDKTVQKYFYRVDPEVVAEIVKRMRAIFVDSTFRTLDNKGSRQTCVTVNW